MTADPDVIVGTEASITVCPDGPLLVRGPVTIVDGAGRSITPPSRMCALCRCGRTSRTPFCDGTHKKRKRVSPAEAS
ncbi:CDGSH iron-sulfur domain-containing protein [Prescottella sp. R16]|uniref:CDGSH iron-sulfur domain-containing protein n=1 Tax=Prescottella sp. R16 TaxID=3064529 RepID=UPI00272E4253|nr:CDGSH iron-sulfur domain-containing protein [Prescottella sp. R16]